HAPRLLRRTLRERPARLGVPAGRRPRHVDAARMVRMSGEPIDLAERRRRRDAQRTAQNDATAPDAATPSPPSSLGGEAWAEGVTPKLAPNLPQTEAPPPSPDPLPQAGSEERASIAAIAPNDASTAPSIPYAELHCLSDFSFQ